MLVFCLAFWVTATSNWHDFTSLKSNMEAGVFQRKATGYDDDFLIGYGEQRLKYLTGRVFTELP